MRQENAIADFSAALRNDKQKQATAKTDADSPFDFTQGRLFGDDNKRARARTKAEVSWLVDGLHPTLRDETAKDGAP